MIEPAPPPVRIPKECGKRLHRELQKRSETIPIARDLPKAEVVGYSVEGPGSRNGLEQPDHESAHLLAVVGVTIRVFQDRHVRRHAFERLTDQIGVLDCLERNGHTGERTQPASPHPGSVHDKLRFDVAVIRPHACDTALGGRDPGDLEQFLGSELLQHIIQQALLCFSLDQTLSKASLPRME